MLNVTPGPERESLGFKDAVVSSFRFLTDMGLHLVDEKATFVRYESSDVFINIFHGRASYEINVEIGRIRDINNRLSIAGIVDWAGAYNAEGFGRHVMFQTNTRDGIQESVPRLASLVKKYAVPLLRNEDSAWGKALQLQAHRWNEYINEVNMTAMREKADAAWRKKDYVRVVELYDAVRQNLTEVEAKKLAYAEHHILTSEAAGTRHASRNRSQ